jgi:hypothetical protein
VVSITSYSIPLSVQVRCLINPTFVRLNGGIRGYNTSKPRLEPATLEIRPCGETKIVSELK